MAEAFQACRAASQSISAASNGGRGSQEAADACSPRRRAIRHRHSAVDEGRGGRVVARHICQRSFDLLKTMVTEEPILVYPDPSKPYILFTDASKYAWSCVLTQEYTHMIADKNVTVLHPISYQSGLFKGSQLNWACLTKEAYAIYMSIKKLDYYLVDADIILRSDHLPLKKFLTKNTLNSKVNNWAVEISPFRITFEYIKGIKNTLADTMSRLIDIDPESQLPPEEQGCEYGYYLFDPLPPISIDEVCHVDDIPEITVTNPNQITSTYFVPRTLEVMLIDCFLS